MSNKAPCTVRGRRSQASEQLARETGIAEPLTRFLLVRGVATPEDIRRFLAPAPEHLHSPHLLCGIDTAVARLRRAVLGDEPILIYGDYDVDGTIATVVLKTALDRFAHRLGHRADVRYHIPHRIREGYGMQEQRLALAAEEGVRLVVSVDTGIRAFTAADECRRLGMDLIVTDHHLPDGAEGVPDALSVINPNQPGCDYPFKALCGAAVAFKLAEALLEDGADPAELERVRGKLLPSLMKLVAIATVADAVPLTGENRVIASVGLKALANPAHPGLRRLMELARIDLDRPVTATAVGFRLAPRVNAAGRMDVADDVVEMLLTRDAVLATQLAEKLDRLNDERRATEAVALRSLEAQIEALRAADALYGCLVFDDSAESTPWHRGVIGILGSRVVERTGLPALIVTVEDGVAHGSGRSVADFPLLEALTEAHHAAPGGLFARYGGHAMAVGFALPANRLPELREAMRIIGQRHLPNDPVLTTAVCDIELKLDEMTPDLFNGLGALEPFGHGFQPPVFLSSCLRLKQEPRILKDRHVRLLLEDPETGRTMSAVAWARRESWAEVFARQQWVQGSCLDVAYRLNNKQTPGFEGWEMEILELWQVQP